jgi:hypothetical protein
MEMALAYALFFRCSRWGMPLPSQAPQGNMATGWAGAWGESSGSAGEGGVAQGQDRPSCCTLGLGLRFGFVEFLLKTHLS